ncbi:MAG: DUF1559 domain-containing protein, partial [Planctomycetota bacterium]
MRRCRNPSPFHFGDPIRPAFTMLEILVVIMVIATLVALLLPAVQSIRESARLHSCQRQMTQIGIKLHSYENAKGYFPQGSTATRLPVVDFPDDHHFGWMLRMEVHAGTMPSERIEAADETQSVYRPRNWRFAECDSSPPGSFCCPSNPSFVAIHYAGVHDGRIAPLDENSRGMFRVNQAVRRRDVVD